MHQQHARNFFEIPLTATRLIGSVGFLLLPAVGIVYPETMNGSIRRQSMSWILALLFGAAGAVSAFGSNVVRFIREPAGVAFSLQKGYGVQRDGKHELVFTAVSTGKIVKTVKIFRGEVASEDKKYFSRLEPVRLPATTGKLRVTGRIFYCSFAQKFCSVQRVDEEI